MTTILFIVISRAYHINIFKLMLQFERFVPGYRVFIPLARHCCDVAVATSLVQARRAVSSLPHQQDRW